MLQEDLLDFYDLLLRERESSYGLTFQGYKGFQVDITPSFCCDLDLVPFLRLNSQNTFDQHSYKRHLNSLRTLHLREGQTFLLSSSSTKIRCVRLSFKKGVARISGAFGGQLTDVTLAFCGPSEEDYICIPQDTHLLVEALSESFLEFHYENQCPINNDLISQWLLKLHLVRHPVGADSRLLALLKLLISHFGIRRGDGYFLPFSIAHARMAELIGATRSTVTRQITLLRQQDDLSLIEPSGHFLLSERLFESFPELNI